MRLSIDAQADSLSARNRVDEARKRAELAKQAKAVEIIGDSGNSNANEGASEIIQDFPRWNARVLGTVPPSDKCLKYNELSGNWNAPCRASGNSTPPFRGECPEVTFDDSSPIPVTYSAGDSNKTRPALPVTDSAGDSNKTRVAVPLLR